MKIARVHAKTGGWGVRVGINELGVPAKFRKNPAVLCQWVTENCLIMRKIDYIYLIEKSV